MPYIPEILGEGKRLYPTTFDPRFYNPYFFLIPQFTTFALQFRRDSADLLLDQHNKDKMSYLDILIGL